MTFDRPSLEDLIQRTEVELAARLGLGPVHRRSVLAVLGRVAAGLAHSAHGHLEQVAAQIHPQTATGMELDRHASLRGLARKPATFARGQLQARGDVGSEIPVLARWQSQNGTIYETTAPATLGAGGTATVQVEAVLPGAGSNAAVGSALTLQSALPGVVATATALALEGGEDQETDEALRARLLVAWRSRPQAGTESDYEQWALEVPGVTRAFAIGRRPNLGSVTLYVVADGNTPTIAPSQAQLDGVVELVNQRRPITARVIVEAPELVPVNLTIRLEPSTPAV